MRSNDEVVGLVAEGYREVSPRTIFGRGSQLADGGAVSEGCFAEGSADEIFGTASTLAESEAIEELLPSLTQEPVFHLLVAASLVAYLFMLYHSWGFIGAIWKGVFSTRQSEHRMASEGGALPLSRFKLTASFIGIASVALIGVKLLDSSIRDNAPIYDSSLTAYFPLLGLIVVGIIIAWNYAFHKIAMWLTHSDILAMLAATTHMNFVRSIVVLYPLIAIWCVADTSINTVASVIVIIGGILTLLIYLKDTFILFIGKKISILYWILYLCTAILLPLSFFAVLLPDKLG